MEIYDNRAYPASAIVAGAIIGVVKESDGGITLTLNTGYRIQMEAADVEMLTEMSVTT